MRKTGSGALGRHHVVNALSAAVLGVTLCVVSASGAPPMVLRPGRAAPGAAAETKPAAAEPVQQGGDRDPGSIMDHAAESGAQVFVDDSFASVEKMRNAIRQANQGQAQLAINNFQDIITNYGQKLVYLNDKSYISITDYVREKLLEMPAVRQGMYDQLFGGEAKKAVDGAIERRDVATLIRVCDKFFPSSAALAGLSQAAEWYFERGEFTAASRTWQELLAHPLAGKMQGEFVFRAAVAEALAHNGTAAKKFRDRLEKSFPNMTGMVSGEEVKLISKLDEILAMPAWDPVDLSREEWPAFGGGPARTALLTVNATIGARLWGLTFGDESVQGSSENLSPQEQALRARQAQLLRARGLPEQDGAALNSFPVLSNGSLFIHTGDRIKAVSANAGTELWSYPQQPIPRMDATTELNIRNNMGIAVKLASLDSVSVFEDKVLAVMPAMGRNSRSYDSSGSPVPNTRVVCISRDDGKEIWSRSAEEIKIDTPGALWFVGSPTVTRQGVFVMARKASNGAFAQQYLVRLDRETGSVTWSCYICSTSTGSYYGSSFLSMSSIAVPTIVDDIVYVASGQGADCAIDANVGRILWLRITDSDGAKRTPGEYYNPPINYTAPWKNNPPIIVGDKMVACDTGKSLRIYNRWDGKLMKSLAGSDFDANFKIELLEGAVGSHVIIGGNSRTLSFDLDQVKAKGSLVKPDWWVDVPVQEAGKPQGRPFLSENYCYVPYEHRLVRIDLASGKSDSWEWPKTEKDTPGKPGNLLVTSEQVIVVNDTEMAGYSKWETARDNRLAKIKAMPANPEPYLSLAEISFRTNHSDLATEYMKKSIDLANAGETGTENAGKPMGEILKRLYRTNLNFAEQLLGKSDTSLRDQSRFYYEQCRASARDPEQQAEWRLRLAELSLKQKKYDEAATLYSEVLTDPALRGAGFRDTDAIASAGATAEQRLRKLVADQGAGLYTRFEEQAAGLLQKARTQHDLSALQRLVDSYPNSTAAIVAATELSTAYRDKQEWESARKVLWWLEPRVKGEVEARAIADLVTVCIGLKKYPSAAAWAARGERQFKDIKLANSNGDAVTFKELRAIVSRSGHAEADGRLPEWSGVSTQSPEMDGTPMDKGNALAGSLLVPAESAPGLRPPNVMFLQRGDMLHIMDATGNHVGQPVLLPKNQTTVLLGTANNCAILMQSDMIVGVDIRSHKVWTRHLPVIAGAGANPNNVQMQRINGRVVINGNNANGMVIINGNQVMVNGNQIAIQADGQMIDPNTGLPLNRNLLGMLSGDPDAVRRMAFQSLGSPNFTTARLLNGRIIVVAGTQMTAYDASTGESAWKNGDAALAIKLPGGMPLAIAGNEDVIVTQIDSADGNSSSFYVVDADSGKFRKQFKLENEHPNWRAIGDDGTLFVVSDKSVACYDLVGDQNKPLWLQAGIDTRFAAATALTLDGLIVVDNSMDVMCLSLESGEFRWPKMRLSLTAPTGSISRLRSTVDGDLVIFQGDSGITAIRSMFSEKGQKAWDGSYTPLETPSRQSLQISDPYLVEFAQGQLGNAQNGVTFIFRDRKGGKLALTQRVSISSTNSEGPQIRAWQMLDGALAIDVNGETHLWRNKAGEPATAP